MKRFLILLGAVLCLMAIPGGYAQGALYGIVDVKLTEASKLEGYEKVRHWDVGDAKLNLHVKYGEAEKVLTDILLFNKGPGDVAAVGCPDGYENIGHWDTTGSTDAFGTKNLFNSSICVQYGTMNRVKSVLVTRGKLGGGREPRGVWSMGKEDYHLYIER